MLVESTCWLLRNPTVSLLSSQNMLGVPCIPLHDTSFCYVCCLDLHMPSTYPEIYVHIYIYVYSVYINESSHILGCSRYPVRKYHDMSPARHASADPRPSTKRATSTRLRQTTPLGDWGIMFLSWGVQTYPLVI